MGAPQLRKEVEQMIREADERFLKLVHALGIAYRKEADPEDQPQSLEEYNRDIEQGLKEIAAGKTISQEELERLSKQW